jgi:Tfp pilus assembly protein PilV
MPTLNVQPLSCCRARSRRAGFTLVEMMIAVFVFWMMIALFGAILPIAGQGSRSGSSYAQAALLAQHKTDQLRQGGFNKLNASQMASMKIIDADTNGAPITATTPAGLPAGTTSYSFTNVDNLVDNGANQGYFPAGAQGILSLSPALGGSGAGGPTTSQALQVTVTLTWQNSVRAGAAANGSAYSTHTVIASY